MRGGLDKTLMQRIVANKPDVVTLLKIQYRMNEQIMRFSSDWFYHGMVEAAPEVKHRSILDLDRPMEWVDTSGELGVRSEVLGVRSEDGEGSSNNPSSLIPHPSSIISHPSSIISHPSSELESFRETFVGETFGRINKAEAHLTIQMLCNYFERIGKQRLLDERIDVGVISPYRAQVQYLRRLIMKNEYLKPFRRSISVNTVDGFQGQERDIIVVSLVRSNDEGQIGFLRDLRRMNVAITRARMKLIIIGDQSTMTSHPFYRKLYQLCCAIE
jgi:superfamily I DNA and/or RNA helicase